MECFLTTGIDTLILHDLIITKNALHGVMSPILRVFSDVRAIVQASTTPA